MAAEAKVQSGNRVETQGNTLHLPRYVQGNRSLQWWGVFFVVVIELTIFATLFSSYFYLRAAVEQWPPDGIGLPEMGLPLVATFVLLVGVWFARDSVRSIRRNDEAGLQRNLAILILIGLVYIALRTVEFDGATHGFTTNAYSSIFWTVVWFHVAHVIGSILMAGALFVAARQGHFHGEKSTAIEGNAQLWTFGAAVNIAVFVVLYLSPIWL